MVFDFPNECVYNIISIEPFAKMSETHSILNILNQFNSNIIDLPLSLNLLRKYKINEQNFETITFAVFSTDSLHVYIFTE